MIRSLLFLLALPCLAHDVITTKITWTREVSRIVYKHCASCHRDGGAAFSLMTYEEARPWAKAMKEEVLSRRMPPWNAVKGFGEFRNDRGLTQEDLEIISDWVEGGAPDGNALYLPPKPGAVDISRKAPGRKLAVSGSLVTKQAIDAVGIASADGALQIVAHLPDGRIVPMIWIERFSSAYSGPYYFRNPLRLPAGAKVEITPPSAGATLLISTPKPGR